MSGIATAIVGSALVGGVASKMASDKAADTAQSATDAQTLSAQQSLNFQKEQYEDWKNIFGDTQKQLADYYKQLTPEVIEVAGVQNIEKEYTAAREQISRDLAQRGLDSSGLAADTMTRLGAEEAMQKANFRINAPAIVNQAKQQFLGLGLGQQQTIQQGITGTYNQMAASYGQQASQANLAQQQAYAGIGQAVGSGASAFLTYSALNK